MKIQIKSLLEKQPEPFKMDNGGTRYDKNVYAIVDGGPEQYYKVCAFKPDISSLIVPGAELSAGEKIGEIKTKKISYTKKNGEPAEYTQITLYAPKKEFGAKGSFSGGRPAPSASWEDYEAVVRKAATLSKELFPEQAVQAFDKILGVASVIVKIGNHEEKKQFTREMFDAMISKCNGDKGQLSAVWKHVVEATKDGSCSKELYEECKVVYAIVAPSPKTDFDDSDILF